MSEALPSGIRITFGLAEKRPQTPAEVQATITSIFALHLAPLAKALETPVTVEITALDRQVHQATIKPDDTQEDVVKTGIQFGQLVSDNRL